MTDMDPLQMQIDMLKAQVETQKTMYRQMYATSPEMAEQFCAQLDQNLELQVQMLTQMMGAAQATGSNAIDQMEQARSVMNALGYSEEEIQAQLMGIQEDDELPLTERVMSSIDPSSVSYSDIVDMIAAVGDLPEGPSADLDPAMMRRFEILLTGMISTVNDHRLDALEVEPETEENRQMVASILSDYWGVDGRDDLMGTLHYLVTAGHTADYVSNLEIISKGGTAEDLFEEDMNDEDRAMIRARFDFTSAYASQIDPMLVRGWDMGRAANVTRWGYFCGYIDEEEAWNILDMIAESLMESFDSWRSFAQSYMFGGMFWKCAWGPEDLVQYGAQLLASVEILLTEGEWKDFPWASGRA